MSIRKNKLIVISIILIIFSILVGCTSKEELVAKVNDEGITKIQFEANFNIQKMIIEGMVGSDIWTQEMEDGRIYEDVIRESILQSLIKEALIMEEAEKQGIEASEEEVESQVEEMKARNGGEDNFRSYLKQYDVSEENIKDIITRGIIVSKYREKIIQELAITDEDLREFFNENKEDFVMVKTKHILVESEEEAREVIEEINQGKDFSELAKERSIDPNAVVDGGDLDYFQKGDIIISQFEEAAFALEVGEVSEPVETDDGYYIIKVVDKKDNFEDLKEQVNSEYQNKMYNDKIEELKSKAQIEIYSEEE